MPLFHTGISSKELYIREERDKGKIEVEIKVDVEAIACST